MIKRCGYVIHNLTNYANPALGLHIPVYIYVTMTNKSAMTSKYVNKIFLSIILSKMALPYNLSVQFTNLFDIIRNTRLYRSTKF